MTTTVDLKLRRADCFKLLAACFYEPDKELFLQERLCENLPALLAGCHCRQAATAATGMAMALLQLSEQEMRLEYARLFVGPFELIAPPYGSVYLERQRRLMGDSTMAVWNMYREAGLSLAVKEAPDHIALELEFMHFLCLREADAVAMDSIDRVGKYAALQMEFIRSCLAPWVPGFCENIRRGTENGFYRLLADCLESFLEEISSAYETANRLKEPRGIHDCRPAVQQH